MNISYSKEIKIIQNVDIIYFLNEKDELIGKIDLTMKIIEGNLFKGFKKRG